MGFDSIWPDFEVIWPVLGGFPSVSHGEVRVLMAKMGFRNMDELIGHAEVLRQDPAVRGPLQLEAILAPAHQLPDAGKMGLSALETT